MTGKLKAQDKFLYERVCHAIEKQIQDGSLGPGARLPSETELASTFSVHTLTVRRALRMLEKHGRLSRQHGRGTGAWHSARLQRDWHVGHAVMPGADPGTELRSGVEARLPTLGMRLATRTADNTPPLAVRGLPYP